MKIISEIKNDTYLVSLNKTELANVLGYYSTYDKGCIDSVKNIINEEIDVEISDIYKKHRLIVSLQTLAEYDTARKKLKDMLDALTPIEGLIIKLDKAKE